MYEKTIRRFLSVVMTICILMALTIPIGAIGTNIYNGDKQDFYFNNHWLDGSDDAYTFSKDGNTTTVTYDKTNANYAWGYAPIQGNFSDFNQIVMTVQGTPGKTMIFKVESYLFHRNHLKHHNL